MLQLRNPQIAALAEGHRAAFLERLSEHVGRVFPGEVERLGADETARLIGAGVAKARGYGITSQRNVALLVDLMFGVDAAFESLESMAWAVRILKDRGLSESGKMTLIYEQLPKRVPHTSSGS